MSEGRRGRPYPARHWRPNGLAHGFAKSCDPDPACLHEDMSSTTPMPRSAMRSNT